MRLSVDTGGTFTDLIVEDDDGRLTMYKAATTPGDLVQGLMNGIELAAADRGTEVETLLGQAELLIHATTTTTNAVLTGQIAKTAFITTAGHPDILVLREGGRMGLPTFDYSIPYPAPYVPRALTFEAPERIGADGKVVTPLDEAAIVDIIEKLEAKNVEAVGVCLLWAVANPVHEQRIGEMLDARLPEVAYTLSYRVNPTLREYRRASSTCIDASLKPLMSRYLNAMEERLRERGFRGKLLVVTSQGGVMESGALADCPVHSLKSGPAMAPVAGRYYARLDGAVDTVIVADTGGTSYDVSVVRKGRIPWSREAWIGIPYLGHMTGFPSVDVRSIGAGGGSIASVDDGGLLHVGPQSAGSTPGPVCYKRGGARPTVTDAALVQGFIDPDYFLGGQMKLDVGAARDAIERDVGAPLSLDGHQAAAAILTVATENMIGAIEDVTINQGIDPREAVLVGGGGAAGLNCVNVARRLGCAKVIIPDVGAALSAAGGHISELSAEFASLLVTACRQFDFDAVNHTLAGLRGQCDEFIAGAGANVLEQNIELFVEARYAEQIWEVEVPLRHPQYSSHEMVETLEEDFHHAHHELFAIEDRQSEIELILWRAKVRCRLREADIGSLDPVRGEPVSDNESREVYFEETGLVETRVLRVSLMEVGQSYPGPVIVESPFTTVVVDPNAQVTLSKSGSLVITP